MTLTRRWQIGCVALAITAWVPGCQVDEAGSDTAQDPGATGDLADVPGDTSTTGCGALPNCANVLMGCIPSAAGQCFDCCDRDSAEGVPMSACCPAADVQEDVPPEPGLDAPTEVALDVSTEVSIDVPQEIAVDVPPDVAIDAPREVALEVSPDVAIDAPQEVAFDARPEAIDVSQVDNAADDPGPDCGQTMCIDCVCRCADGRMLPYGGCFDECNPPPDVVRNCSADCDAACGNETPRNCQNPGSQGDCPEGQTCVEAPCPRCGMQPQSYCVATPCTGSGCYTGAHCGEGQQCYGAYVPSGTMGFCSPPPTEAVGCWTDSECPSGASCVGPTICPPCMVCGAGNSPGTCRPAQGTPESIVLWVPGSLFSPGETIPVTWYDFTARDVFLAGCSKYSIEEEDASTGSWIDRGPPFMCGVEGVAVRVAAGKAFRDFPWQAPIDGLTSPLPRFRLRGQYWTDCLPDLPISTAKCSGGPFDVLSMEFTVGMAP